MQFMVCIMHSCRLAATTNQLTGLLPTFRDSISVPSSRVKLALEGRADRLSLNVDNYQRPLRNIPEEQRSHIAAEA
jgi:hypothetical protein